MLLSRRQIALFGVLMVGLALLLPAVDLPDTVYNEADAPIAAVTAPVTTLHLQAPASKIIGVPDIVLVSDVLSSTPRVEPVVAQSSSHSLQSLLHTFLC